METQPHETAYIAVPSVRLQQQSSNAEDADNGQLQCCAAFTGCRPSRPRPTFTRGLHQYFHQPWPISHDRECVCLRERVFKLTGASHSVDALALLNALRSCSGGEPNQAIAATAPSNSHVPRLQPHTHSAPASLQHVQPESLPMHHCWASMHARGTGTSSVWPPGQDRVASDGYMQMSGYR